MSCSLCTKKEYRKTTFCIKHYKEDLQNRKKIEKRCLDCNCIIGFQVRVVRCKACRHNKFLKDVDYPKHKEERQKATREYKKKNRDKINKRQKEREDKDITYKISRRLRHRIYMALKNNHKTSSAVDDLGCPIEDFKLYLEQNFQLGMCWDNYGEWHIDHIRPLASFDMSNPEQLKQACHYTNLQPLWAKDNLVKSDRYS